MKTKILLPILSLVLRLSLSQGMAQNYIPPGVVGATISGGDLNTNKANYATIGGGNLNLVDTSSLYSTIGGGRGNGITNGAQYVTIAGGRNNWAGAHYAVVAGVANTASGWASAAPGGYQNLAGGDFSFAAGRRAKAYHEGAFVWADPTVEADFASTAPNQFLIRATGGVGIGTTSPQAPLDVNGRIRATTLLLTSDRNSKTNFVSVNNREMLKKVVGLAISTWQYTNAPGARHIGPMAQDFKAAFDLGEDDKHIATVDADGVALASIQALYETLQEQDSEIAALKRQSSALKTELAGVKSSMSDRLAALEKAMSKNLLQASFRPGAAR